MTTDRKHTWVNGKKKPCPREMMTEAERAGNHRAPHITGGIGCADCGQMWPGTFDAPCPGVAL